MAAFIFIGNGKSDPSEIRLFGHNFPLNGDAVEVSEETAKKLASNSHFKEVKVAESSEKDELEALARTFGVELDKRKSLANLRKQVQELIDGSQDGS